MLVEEGLCRRLDPVRPLAVKDEIEVHRHLVLFREFLVERNGDECFSHLAHQRIVERIDGVGIKGTSQLLGDRGSARRTRT